MAIPQRIGRSVASQAQNMLRTGERFKRFDARPNRARFRRLFGSVEGPHSGEPAAAANEGEG